MAIDRKLVGFYVTILDSAGTIQVESDEIVTDTEEGFSGGRRKNWNAGAVKDACALGRDAIMAQAEQQGKPMHF
jgi:hypothetical protein